MNQLLTLIVFSILFSGHTQAALIKVNSELGQPLSAVMVTQSLIDPGTPDTSDDGYQKPNFAVFVAPDITVFTDAKGVAQLPDRAGVKYRLRKMKYIDQEIIPSKEGKIVGKKDIY